MNLTKTLTKSLLGFIAFVAVCSASAQPLDIKGISIGDSQEKVREILAANPRSSSAIIDTQIAGISARALPRYRDNKLIRLYIRFNSQGFDRVREALSEKYQNLDCKKSLVNNAMGANFEQVECMVSDDADAIYLVRFAGEITNGSITLMSKEDAERDRQAEKAKKKDI